VLNRDDPDRYASILDLDAVESFVFGANLRSDHLQLIRDGETDRSEYLYPSGLVDAVSVGRLFDDGHSIVLPQAHQRITSLGHLVRGLEAELSCRVQANVYLSPPGESSFAPHFDAHDVLVLQAHGAKNWTLFEGPAGVGPTERFDPGRHQPGPEVDRFTLEQGDLCYVPTGVMHHANAAGVSLHVTVGIHWVRQAHVIEALVRLAIARGIEYQQIAPHQWWRPGARRQAAVTQVKDLVTGMGDDDLVGEALDHLRDELVSTRQPLVPGQLGQLARLDDVGAETVVAPRDPMLWDLRTEPDRAVLTCFGSEIAFPPTVVTALTALLTAGRDGIAVGDVGSELSPEETLVLVRRLVREGVLEIRD
jgi:hypothetical protein